MDWDGGLFMLLLILLAIVNMLVLAWLVIAAAIAAWRYWRYTQQVVAFPEPHTSNDGEANEHRDRDESTRLVRNPVQRGS